MGSVDDFLPRARALERPRVLELGTKRSKPDRCTRHDQLLPNAGEYLGTDIEDGTDVDVVADLHRLSEVAGVESFDVILSFSTFEHLRYPHIAAHEIMKSLRVGGLLFIQTHQTFCLHSFPCDYFRFSTDALASLFGTQMGFRVVGVEYRFPAEIHAPEVGVQRDAYLNVHLFGEKIAKTPDHYVYDLGPKTGLWKGSLDRVEEPHAVQGSDAASR